MPTLTEILEDPARNGVYRLTSDVVVPKVVSTAHAEPDVELITSLSGAAEVIRLDGRHCPDKDSLLAAIGHALHFPAYYGMNWDALEECLFDLSWWVGPVIVLIEHADAIDREVLMILVDVWTEAATAWSEAGRVCVLLLGAADELAAVPSVEP